MYHRPHLARLLRWRLSLGTHAAGGGGRRRVLVPRRGGGHPDARRPLDQRDQPLTAGAVHGDHVRRRHARDRVCGSADRRRELAHAGYVDASGRLESGRAATARRERLGGGGGRRAGAAVAGPGPGYGSMIAIVTGSLTPALPRAGSPSSVPLPQQSLRLVIA